MVHVLDTAGLTPYLNKKNSTTVMAAITLMNMMAFRRAPPSFWAEVASGCGEGKGWLLVARLLHG